MAEVDHGGQQPVDEDQSVLGSGANSAATGPRRQSGLVPLVPQRADLGTEFSDHIRGSPVTLWLPMIAARTRFPTTPTTPTMINAHGFDAPPLTMHELVRTVPHKGCGPPVGLLTSARF
ncbi:hypothetical protein [Streptomyces sp. NPDC055287]